MKVKDHPVYCALDYDKISKYITNDREPFFEVAKMYLKKEDSVLDVGCGQGEFADYIGNKDVFMVDGNKETVDALKTRFSNVQYSILPALPFKDKKFNLIHCSHVIEHLDSETLYLSLKEFDRCLKPGGYLVFSAPVMWEGFFNDLSHIRPYSIGVFHHYLIRSDYLSTTRGKISNSYVLVDHVKRYNIKPPTLYCVIRKGLWGKFLRKVYNACALLMSFIGVRQLGVTGETLVFRKQNGNGATLKEIST